MKRIDRYVLWLIAGPAIMALVVTCFVGVANELRERVKLLPIDQVTLTDATRLMGYFLPTLISYVAPITFMMGILMAFGRLSQHNEMIAMKAAGIPLKRIVAPVVLTGLVLSMGCFLIQDRVQTWAMSRVYSLIFEEMPMRISLDTLPAGVMHDFRGLRVYFLERNPDTRALEKIDIQEKRPDGLWVYHADSALLTRNQSNGRMKLVMENVHVIPPVQRGQLGRVRAPRMELQLPEASIRGDRAGRRGMPIEALLAHEQSLAEEVAVKRSDKTVQDLLKVRWEIGDRLSLPFACLAVSLVAAPLGARAMRGGRSYSFAAGFVIILVYYTLQMLAEPKSLNPLLEVVLRAWIPNAVMCAAGIVLLWRVDRV